ncbi:MAG: heavy-metal-associated domain-containing protein [Polyangiaceae bacterium]|nr:heavy-metal-associated domain-containing protein [Polyangiaceae bacterium]
MKESLLQVDGMTCPSCIRLIESALCELDGVDTCPSIRRSCAPRRQI